MRKAGTTRARLRLRGRRKKETSPTATKSNKSRSEQSHYDTEIYTVCITSLLGCKCVPRHTSVFVFILYFASIYAPEGTLFSAKLVNDATSHHDTFRVSACYCLLRIDTCARQSSLVWELPEHLIEDVLELILFLTNRHPETLGTSQLYPLMTMVSAAAVMGKETGAEL